MLLLMMTRHRTLVSILVPGPNKDVDTAKEIMIEILNKGRGVAGAYSFEVAEQKCVETTTHCKNNYPRSNNRRVPMK